MQSTIIYHGTAASPYRGTITAVLFQSLDNPKTGPCMALAILVGDGTDAVRARMDGRDSANCGTCPFRSLASGGLGGCYVSSVALMGYAGAARSAWQRPIAMPGAWPTRNGSPLPLRLGAYGDPSALPQHVVINLCAVCEGAGGMAWGYTHGWRHSRAQYLREWCMASVEDAPGQAQAIAKGWRVYRIAQSIESIPDTGLMECESAQGVACVSCGQCSGVTGSGNGRAIVVHGPSVKRASAILANNKAG